MCVCVCVCVRASKTLVPVLSLKICITCSSCTDEPLKSVSGDLSLRESGIFPQKVNSEYSCVSCEVHQLTEMCDMQRTVWACSVLFQHTVWLSWLYVKIHHLVAIAILLHCLVVMVIMAPRGDIARVPVETMYLAVAACMQHTCV